MWQLERFYCLFSLQKKKCFACFQLAGLSAWSAEKMSKSAWPSCETWWGHYTVNKHCPFSSIMHPATWQKLFRNGLRNMIEFKVLSQISIQSTHSEVFWSPCLDASELVWQHGGDLHNILYICKCIMFVYLGICTWMCFCMIMRLWWCINVNLLNLNFLHGLMN